jgi:hypothetical protein
MASKHSGAVPHASSELIVPMKPIYDRAQRDLALTLNRVETEVQGAFAAHPVLHMLSVISLVLLLWWLGVRIVRVVARVFVRRS